jgi:hypothetical protein
MEPYKFPTQDGRQDVPSMMPSSERRSKERHDPAASSSYSRCPKRGAARFSPACGKYARIPMMLHIKVLL